MTEEFVPLVPMSPYHKQGARTVETPIYHVPAQQVQPERTRIHKPLVNRSDLYSLLAVLACFTLAVTAVVDKNFAIRLGQTNQLIILGFVLSVMSAITLQRAHALLLLLEARFGSSTLQNYDAILRDSKFATQSSITIKLALLALFALPLGLSASYKRYVGGRTDTSLSNHETLLFGPSGPPGLFSANGRSLFVNATSALYAGQLDVPRRDLPFNSSYGYNMHVINATVTAMLDAPIITDSSFLKSKLQRGTYLTISAPVNVTFARLNSTPNSPERQDHGYWDRLTARFSTGNIVTRPEGYGSWFAIWSGWVDNSIVFLSYYNTTTNESFIDGAIGFNLYRGTANGTWRTSSDSIVLQEANNFQTDFFPNMHHPEVVADSCNPATTPNSPQKIIFCGWSLLSTDYAFVLPDYLVGWSEQTGRYLATTSTWVAIVAAMGWSSRVSQIGNFGQVAPQNQYLLQKPSYLVSASYPTLHRNAGLFATLAVQPLLLVLVVLARTLFRSTPISDDFGLIALLAGMRRQNLDCLDGASYSGRLEEKVAVEIIVREDGRRQDGRVQGAGEGPVVEYVLSRVDTVSSRRSRFGWHFRGDNL